MTTPLPEGYQPSPSTSKANPALHSKFQQVIGSLLYIMLGMSPAPWSSHLSDGAWVRWGANRSPDTDRWFAMTQYSRFV